MKHQEHLNYDHTIIIQTHVTITQVLGKGKKNDLLIENIKVQFHLSGKAHKVIPLVLGSPFSICSTS
jgi:hypothetical protein